MFSWKGWFAKQADRDLDDEIRAHLNLAARDRETRGESIEEARRNARREFGNELLIKESTRSIWAWVRLERMAQDIRISLRQLRRNPGYATVAVLMLALGLGATATMFSIVNGVLLTPLPFPDAKQLYVARTVAIPELGVAGDAPVNARHFSEWRTGCSSCESASIAQFITLTYIAGTSENRSRPRQLTAMRVSHEFFQTLGIKPALGRGFLPEEELNGNHTKVILTDRLWRSEFEADPSVIGREIQINSQPHTVVGVLPPDLHLPRGDQWADSAGPDLEPLLFRPLGIDVTRADTVGSRNFLSVVRLRPEATATQAAGQMTGLMRQVANGRANQELTSLTPLLDQITRDARQPLWLLFGTVGMVLLIVCLNLSNLVLLRASSRRREASVRLALGAGRADVFALAGWESALLVALGGGLGWGLAGVGLQALQLFAPRTLPRLEEVTMDWRVAVFMAAAALASSLLCALVPAWRLAATPPVEAMKAGAASTTFGRAALRFRQLMVAFEVALSTVLLVAGGLLLMSFGKVLGLDKGFDATQVVAQTVVLSNPKYSPEQRTHFVDEMLPRLAAIPGVRSAGATSRIPLRGENWGDLLIDPTRAAQVSGNPPLANFRFVSTGYFEAMGITLLRGRFFEPADRNRLVAVISEAAADQLWPGQDPIGRQVRSATFTGERPGLEVVGVVSEVPTVGLVDNWPRIVYEPHELMRPVAMTFVMRADGDPAPVIRATQSILSDADAELGLPEAERMEEVFSGSMAGRRFEVYLVLGFAASALLLAALGVYGMISYAVAGRTREIGIRIALGARPANLGRLILGQGLLPVIAGLAAGLIAALLLGGYIASELYEVTPNDPATMAAVSAVLLLAAAGACWIPARRAARVDPVRALRAE